MSYRDLEEMLEERRVFVDHTSIFRWMHRCTPERLAAFKKRKAPVGGRWRLDETYVKVNDQHRYLYRAVDRGGDTIDFLLTARQDCKAARRFLAKAIGQNGLPSPINIDKSGATKQALRLATTPTTSWPSRFGNASTSTTSSGKTTIKRRTRPMLGFKSFWTARVALGGIELVHMLRKGQLASAPGQTLLSPVEAFYQLAA